MRNKQEKQFTQSQCSVTEQLKLLINIANKNGLYDAADWVRCQVEAMEKK